MIKEFDRKAIFAKPCPFCGSDRVYTERRDHFYASEDKTCSYIECETCGAELYGMPVRGADGKYISDYNTVQHEVLKRWNRRAAV